MVKQNQKKIPKKSKDSAKRVNRSGYPPQGVTLMPRGPAPRIGALPSTYLNTTLDPTWLTVSGKVTHPELGGGVRVVGRQLFGKIATTATDLQLFDAGGLATVSDINRIQLSPDVMNGRLALQARAYDRYCFRKVVLTYVNRVPTTQAGSFALGYVNDVTTPSATFGNVTQMSPAVQASFITPVARLEIVNDMTTNKTWYCTLDSTSVASQRLTVQGVVVGVPDQTSIGAILQGWLWIDYMIDLYQPTQDEGFSLRLTSSEIADLKANRLAKAEEEKRERTSQDVNNEISQLQLRLQQLKTGNLNY